MANIIVSAAATPPRAPRNVMVTVPSIRNTRDINWDVVQGASGYNVYRSYNPEGDFTKINSSPVLVNQYRDTINRVLVSEDISTKIYHPTTYNNEYIDAFSGVDVKRGFWSVFDFNKRFTFDKGLQYIDLVGTWNTSYLESRFFISDDFTLEIPFLLGSWQHPSQGTQALQITLASTVSNDYIQFQRQADSTQEGFYAAVSSGPATFFPSNSDKGTFIIQRAAGVLTCTLVDDLGNATVVLTSPVFADPLKLFLSGISTNGQFQATFTNVKYTGVIQTLFKYDEHGFCYADLDQKPVVPPSGNQEYSNNPSFVSITVNGRTTVPQQVDGRNGRVYLKDQILWDRIREAYIYPVFPKYGEPCLAQYYSYSNHLRDDLLRNTFYKIVTLDSLGNESYQLNEVSSYGPEIEKVDWIFTEAVRRNRWLLQEAGERVFLYQRRNCGPLCPCIEEAEAEAGQPRGNCLKCFGTGYLGGYERPVEIQIGPLVLEKKLVPGKNGIKLASTPETWTGPFPRIKFGDLVRRQDGGMYFVGQVRTVGARGMLAQHRFPLDLLPTTDVRYKIIVHDEDIAPMITHKGAPNEIKGLTRVFECNTY